MIKMSDTRGFSLIEAVVAIAVLGVGIVSVFTIYHTVIIGQRVSEGILEPVSYTHLDVYKRQGKGGVGCAHGLSGKIRKRRLNPAKGSARTHSGAAFF